MNRFLAFSGLVLSIFIILPSALAHKPYNELHISQVSLKHYPEEIKVEAPGVEVTIGDLHDNS